MSVPVHYPESHIEGDKFLVTSKWKISRNFKSLKRDSVNAVEQDILKPPRQRRPLRTATEKSSLDPA